MCIKQRVTTPRQCTFTCTQCVGRTDDLGRCKNLHTFQPVHASHCSLLAGIQGQLWLLSSNCWVCWAPPSQGSLANDLLFCEAGTFQAQHISWWREAIFAHSSICWVDVKLANKWPILGYLNLMIWIILPLEGGKKPMLHLPVFLIGLCQVMQRIYN